MAARTVAHDIARACLAVRARRLNRMITKLYDDALRAHDVRITQVNLLVAIAVMAPVRAARVGDVLDLEPSTLSRNLERMIKRGWIRATPAEGRAKDLVATAAGVKLLEAIVPAWRDAQRRVEHLIGKDAARALRTLDAHLA
jgi:DNA-binding MarR family transcriptional regulator